MQILPAIRVNKKSPLADWKLSYAGENGNRNEYAFPLNEIYDQMK